MDGALLPPFKELPPQLGGDGDVVRAYLPPGKKKMRDPLILNNIKLVYIISIEYGGTHEIHRSMPSRRHG
jgi:hypothetical protein